MLKAPIKIELLGHLCITQGSRVINRFRTYKTGVLLGYLRYRTSSTWLTIALHGINNLAATIQTFWLSGNS